VKLALSPLWFLCVYAGLTALTPLLCRLRPWAAAVPVAWAGYPAGMVGVPGAPVSNLDPPTLAAVTFGVAQAGLAGGVRPDPRRAVGGVPPVRAW
jgi:hypothetical protein